MPWETSLGHVFAVAFQITATLPGSCFVPFMSTYILWNLLQTTQQQFIFEPCCRSWLHVNLFTLFHCWFCHNFWEQADVPKNGPLTEEQQLLKAVMAVQHRVSTRATVVAAEVETAADAVFHALARLHPALQSSDRPPEILPTALELLINSLETSLAEHDTQVRLTLAP